MREILFRGKRKDNGEWVEGYYVCVGGKFHYILTGQIDLMSGYPRFIYCEVLPETVGQYTGLTDKNGKKIFEGILFDSERRHLFLNRRSLSCGTKKQQDLLLRYKTVFELIRWTRRGSTKSSATSTTTQN